MEPSQITITSLLSPMLYIPNPYLNFNHPSLHFLQATNTLQQKGLNYHTLEGEEREFLSRSGTIMRPSQFHAKKEINPNEMYPSHPLKINRNSHFIKKLPSSLSLPSSYVSSSASSVYASVSQPAATSKPPPRQPVIIYTHSPKVIHTNPNDFMALVQKLTGLSKADGSPNPDSKEETKDGNNVTAILNKNIPKETNSDDSESSVITEDSCHSTILEDVHINSCFLPTPILDPNINPCFNNIPMFTPNDYLCPAHRPFYNNYVDPLFMPNMRNSTSSSTNLETNMIEFREF